MPGWPTSPICCAVSVLVEIWKLSEGPLDLGLDTCCTTGMPIAAFWLLRCRDSIAEAT